MPGQRRQLVNIAERLVRENRRLVAEGNPAHHRGVEVRVDAQLALDELCGRAVAHDQKPLWRSCPDGDEARQSTGAEQCAREHHPQRQRMRTTRVLQRLHALRWSTRISPTRRAVPGPRPGWSCEARTGRGRTGPPSSPAGHRTAERPAPTMSGARRSAEVGRPRPWRCQRPACPQPRARAAPRCPGDACCSAHPPLRGQSARWRKWWARDPSGSARTRAFQSGRYPPTRQVPIIGSCGRYHPCGNPRNGQRYVRTFEGSGARVNSPPRQRVRPE